MIGRVADTLEFFVFGGWRDFFARRQARYDSTVFRINLWRPTIALLDRDAIEPLFASGDIVQDRGFSWATPPPALTGGVLPAIFLSGEAHARWKAFEIALLR
ncbi:MAG: hypothetical protein ABW182_02555, partial [Sphingomonas sp.]